MWPETKNKVECELALLHRLLDSYRSLMAKAGREAPDLIEVSALSAVLHSLYSGFENIFKRIATEIDGSRPTSDRWHAELLQQMATQNEHRPALISPLLDAKLRGYLAFRHVFRNAYTISMEWEQMQDLVENSESVLNEFEDACRSFFEGE